MSGDGISNRVHRLRVAFFVVVVVAYDASIITTNTTTAATAISNDDDNNRVARFVNWPEVKPSVACR